MLLDVRLQLVDFSAFAADDDPGTCSENGDTAATRGAFDQYLWNGGGFELLLEQFADLAILSEELAEFLFTRVPLGAPIASDRDSKTDWICFLSHTEKFLLV